LRKQNFIRKIFSSQVLDLKRESIAKSVCNILGIIKNYALFFLLLSQYPKVKKIRNFQQIFWKGQNGKIILPL